MATYKSDQERHVPLHAQARATRPHDALPQPASRPAPTGRILLHVGIPKTGTTSFQAVCAKHQAHLLAHGVAWYPPLLDESNANEIAHMVLRPGILNDYLEVRDPERISGHVTKFLEDHREQDVVISAESLGFIRTDQECARLRTLLGSADREVDVVVVLRDVDAWWASYTNQAKKVARSEHVVRGSMLDLDRNGWLTDFDGLIDVFQRNFRSVTVVPYDAADVIPSLFDAMNVPLPPAYRALTLNRSVPIPAFNRFIMRRFGGFYHRRFRKGPVGAVWRGTKTLIWAVHDRCCASRRTRDG